MEYLDQPIDRSGTDAYKCDGPAKHFNKPGLMSLGCADYELAVAKPIMDAVQKRAEHPVFGYTLITDEFLDSICAYYKRHYEMEFTRDDIVITPGVLPGIALLLESLLPHGGTVCILQPEYPPFKGIITEHGYKLETAELQGTRHD